MNKKRGFIINWHDEYGSYISENGLRICFRLTLISLLCFLCALIEMIFFLYKMTSPFVLSDSAIFLVQAAGFMTAASSIVKEIRDDTTTFAYTSVTMGLYIIAVIVTIVSFFSSLTLESRRNSLESLYMAVISLCISSAITSFLHVSTFNKIPFKFEHFCFGKRFN